MDRRAITCLLACALATALAPAKAVEAIPLYTYYDAPPFAVDDAESLTVKLAALLTRCAEGRNRFAATYLPRRRLDALIARPDWRGIVAWPNPEWFDDAGRTTFRWSLPLGSDADLVASRRDRPVEFKDANSLVGLRLGGILGHRYGEIDEQLRTGQISREDTQTYEQSLSKLKLGRVDVIFLQSSSMPFHRRMHPDLDQWLFVASRPLSEKRRHAFANRAEGELIEFFDECLRRHPQETAWPGLQPPRGRN